MKKLNTVPILALVLGLVACNQPTPSAQNGLLESAQVRIIKLARVGVPDGRNFRGPYTSARQAERAAESKATMLCTTLTPPSGFVIRPGIPQNVTSQSIGNGKFSARATPYCTQGRVAQP
jgi:hypothetical protein